MSSWDHLFLALFFFLNTQLETSIKNAVLPLIKESRKKTIVLMNCNQNNPDPLSDQNQKTAMQIDEELRLSGIKHSSVNMDGKSKVLSCNIVWWWIAQRGKIKGHLLDAQTSTVFQERCQQTNNYFSIILGQASLNNKTLEQKSNLSNLFLFLNDAEVREKLWLKDNPRLTAEQLKKALNSKISNKKKLTLQSL